LKRNLDLVTQEVLIIYIQCLVLNNNNFKKIFFKKKKGIIGVLASAFVLLCYKDGSYPERFINIYRISSKIRPPEMD
jgi:hypothetical protein